MAGSGQLSRLGGLRALNAVLMSQGAIGMAGGADVIATITTVVATNTSTTTLTMSGNTSKQIPAGCTVKTIPAAGGAASAQLWYVPSLTAAGSGTITVGAQTTRTTAGNLASGDQVLLDGFAPFLSLCTSTPTGAALGTEYAAGTSYARQSVVWTAPTAADPPNALNSNTITYAMGTVATPTIITCGELMDSVTGGTANNRTAFWTFAASRTPQTGDSVQIAPAALGLSDQ